MKSPGGCYENEIAFKMSQIALLFSCLPPEGSGGACPILASYILHNSLAYGADWSHLPLDEPAPCSPTTAEPKKSFMEDGGHLRIQYESPTASFDTSLEDDAGRYIPEGAASPPTSSASGQALNPDGDSPLLSFLLASCSFYDHMLHVWRWDWTPDECTGQGLAEQAAAGDKLTP